MPKTSTISARIDAADKKRAEKVFDDLGITASQAITLFYRQVYLRRGIPFPIELPNRRTGAAVEDARSGAGESFESSEELFEDLGI